MPRLQECLQNNLCSEPGVTGLINHIRPGERVVRISHRLRQHKRKKEWTEEWGWKGWLGSEKGVSLSCSAECSPDMNHDHTKNPVHGAEGVK